MSREETMSIVVRKMWGSFWGRPQTVPVLPSGFHITSDFQEFVCGHLQRKNTLEAALFSRSSFLRWTCSCHRSHGVSAMALSVLQLLSYSQNSPHHRKFPLWFSFLFGKEVQTCSVVLRFLHPGWTCRESCLHSLRSGANRRLMHKNMLDSR